MRVLRLGLAAAAVAMTVGCASPRHEPTQFGSLPGWGGDSYAAALPAIAESCQAFDQVEQIADIDRHEYVGGRFIAFGLDAFDQAILYEDGIHFDDGIFRELVQQRDRKSTRLNSSP